MSRYSIFGEKEIVAKSQWVKIYGTDDDTFTYNDKRILTSSDLPPPFSLANVGNAPNAAGLSYANGVLNGQPADATHPGFITSLAQTFGGNKVFNGTLTANAAIVGNNTLTMAGDSTLEDITSTSIYGATSNVTAPKMLTIGSDGKFSNFNPVTDVALIQLGNGTGASTNYASPSIIPISSISAGNTGVTIDTATNTFALTKPGLYYMNVAIQLDTKTNPAEMQVLIAQSSTSNTGPWGAFGAGQNAALHPFLGAQIPWNAPFMILKTSSAATTWYYQLSAIGNCFPYGSGTGDGVAPTWVNGTKGVQIVYQAIPFTLP